MSTVEIIKNEISKLTGKSKTIRTELGHRQAQKNAWQQIERAYGSTSIAPKSKGKYWDFGGRKGRGATIGDFRTAQYNIKKVIPHITRLTKQHETLTAQISKKKRSLVL